jgi:ADP-ribose pyrophosphatase
VAERREVYAGSLISVEVWPERQREIVRHPGVCAVVPVRPDDTVILVRQYRDAVDRTMLEIPAGTRDVEGEDAEGCALRELEEETGYRAGSIEPLGTIHTSPGFLDERVDLFLARVEAQRGEPEEGVEVIEMPLVEAIDAVRRGDITDAKTVSGLFLAAPRVSASV